MIKKLFGIALFTFVIGACSSVEDSLLETPVDPIEEPGLIAYPRKNNLGNMTRNESMASDWESWETVTLASGDSVFVPWVDTSSSDIPKEIRTDIKATDGWDLIVHTVNGHGERGLNYLIFHNKFTGILKAFYYLEQSGAQLQNTAIWKIHFESPQSLLAFASDYAGDATKDSPSDLYLGNITNNSAKGYSVGWNCFQFELAYDPDFLTGSLQFIPESMTTANITLEGDFESETSGLIISITNSNPLSGAVEGVAKMGGSAAEKWVAKQVADGAFKKIGSLLEGGVKGIVKTGVSKLLGSFIGGFNSAKETTQQVQLKTNGTVKLKGNITSMQSGMLAPISFSISKENVGTLGAWGAVKKPVIYLHPLATYEEKDEPNEFSYIYELEGLNGADIKTIINPELLPYVTSYKFNYDVYQDSGVSVWHALGNDLGNNFEFEISSPYNLYKNIYSITSYCRVPIMYKNFAGDLLPPYGTPAPYAVYLPDAPLGGGSLGFNRTFDLTSHFIVVVTLTLETNINGVQSTVVNNQTFIPDVKWNPTLLESAKGKYYPHVDK